MLKAALLYFARNGAFDPVQVHPSIEIAAINGNCNVTKGTQCEEAAGNKVVNPWTRTGQQTYPGGAIVPETGKYIVCPGPAVSAGPRLAGYSFYDRLTKLESLNLAGCRLGKLIHEDDPAGIFEFGKPIEDPGFQFLFKFLRGCKP
ncbi:hypothetical protein SAMN04489760_10684 [Syntrophus gentianae]|uniref:Uncharacterized protein n=1 Tax=Syntrophus gentianae TaxID=43775 RepID=A0A1H7WED2_9BACT|nr:hypothetical protein SAMN04489760_10684 [Syntrophus gentianae]